LFERQIPVGLWCEGAEVSMVPSVTHKCSRRRATADEYNSGEEAPAGAGGKVQVERRGRKAGAERRAAERDGQGAGNRRQRERGNPAAGG
jgi:hypothetical protein